MSNVEGMYSVNLIKMIERSESILRYSKFCGSADRRRCRVSGQREVLGLRRDEAASSAQAGVSVQVRLWPQVSSLIK
jgi:hypothetical protein